MAGASKTPGSTVSGEASEIGHSGFARRARPGIQERRPLENGFRARRYAAPRNDDGFEAVWLTFLGGFATARRRLFCCCRFLSFGLAAGSAAPGRRRGRRFLGGRLAWPAGAARRFARSRFLRRDL